MTRANLNELHSFDPKIKHTYRKLTR